MMSNSREQQTSDSFPHRKPQNEFPSWQWTMYGCFTGVDDNFLIALFCPALCVAGMFVINECSVDSVLNVSKVMENG